MSWTPAAARLLKYRLDANGETLADQGQVVLREGDVVNGVTVGPLVDMAWQSPIPGYEDKASLLLLDGNNRVFRYNSVDGSTLISFGDPSPWQKATQLEVFSDRALRRRRSRQSDLSLRARDLPGPTCALVPADHAGQPAGYGSPAHRRRHLAAV